MTRFYRVGEQTAYEQDCRRTTIWAPDFQEIPFALAMEFRYTKDEILSVLHEPRLSGCGRARLRSGGTALFRRLLGRAERSSNPRCWQAFWFAPSYYAPTRNSNARSAGRRRLIRLMEEQGYVTAAEAQEALADPAALSEAAGQDRGGNFGELDHVKRPGFPDPQHHEDVDHPHHLRPGDAGRRRGGAGECLRQPGARGFEAQAAIVVMSADGAVRAMGGRARHRGDGPVQPGDAGAAADRLGLQALRLRDRAGPRAGGSTTSSLDARLTIDIPGSGPGRPRISPANSTARWTLTEALARLAQHTPPCAWREVGRDLVAHGRLAIRRREQPWPMGSGAGAGGVGNRR